MRPGGRTQQACVPSGGGGGNLHPATPASPRLPSSYLPAACHAEVQLALKGVQQDGCEVWDNNAGRNWQVAVELVHGQGLVLEQQPDPRATRVLASGLLLRIEALTAQRLLTNEQGELLRNLAWQADFGLLRAYQQVEYCDDRAVASLLISRCGFLRRPGLHVVHIASEMVPLAKVGGLGDVVTSLAKAHQAIGTLVEIILPKYDCANYSAVSQLRQLAELQVAWDGQHIRTVVWSCIVDGLPVYLIEPHCKAAFFWRGTFYGAPDDIERFLFFARAALEWLLASGKQPDVLHLHDWQSAAVAPLLSEEYRGRGLSRPRCMSTIHNIAFQGWCSPSFLRRAGLDPSKVAVPGRMLDDSRPGFEPGSHDVSLLRGAVVYSDRVTTVSPTYAREVHGPEFGMGMQAVLGAHAHKFSGVLNGIDYEAWDPATDPALPVNFSASNLGGKEECKRLLLQELHLPYMPPGPPDASGRLPQRPLLAVVSRLTQQKGLPLILAGVHAAIARGAQVVLLGSAPEPQVQAQFEALAASLASGPDARLVLRHDEGLAHRLYAAADLILIPSLFEPCGLTQLIGLRYGAVPVARATGGLADTVRDVARSGAPEHERNGFTFSDRTEAAVEEAVCRAIDAYWAGHDWWRCCLVPRCMYQDWSWSRSAQAYLDAYRSMV